ncbi:flagellar hook-length control protein FliK [Roseibium sp. SCP14]|uniref:flagellar hook-length control protein FliK n=1 Tax=Roseibium sp. SCP14 TaxID=3141375 RepID=UPI00333572CF
MLPFGLITDVSAGALAAGAGNAQSAAQASGGLGAKSAFADELNALEDGNVESVALDGLSGDAGLSEAGVQQAEADIQSEASPSEAGEPIIAAVPPQVSKVVSEFSGDIDFAHAGQKTEDANKQSEAPLPDMGTKNGGSGSGEGALPGVATAPAVDDGVASTQPVSGQAQATPLSEPSAKAVSESQDQALPGGSVKPTLAERAPAHMNVAGEVGQAEAEQSPVPANGNDDSTDAELTVKAAGGVEASATAAAMAAGDGIESASAGAAAKSTPAVARRWQSELPQEFRAPAPRSGQASEQKGADFGSALANVSSAKVSEVAPAAMNGSNIPGNASAHAAQISPVGGAEEAAGPLEPAVVDDGAKVEGGSQTAPVAEDTALKVQGEAATVTVAAGARATTAASGSTPGGEVAAGQSPAAPPSGSVSSEVPASPEPVAEEVALASGKQASATGADVSDAAKRDHSAGVDPSLERPGQSIARGSGTAAPIVNAVLASQMMVDDYDITTSLTDVSVTGEGAAAVRGGDLTGAVRTESLQAPSQAQSGQAASQVAAEIARNLKNGQTRFQMRFDPPELGRVEVNMKVASDGSVQAHLIVERPETLDMFLRDQRGLERALEAAGLNTSSSDLQFSLKQEGGGDFASGEGAQDQSSGDARGEGNADAMEGDPVDEDIVRLTLAEQRGGLDFKV